MNKKILFSELKMTYFKKTKFEVLENEVQGNETFPLMKASVEAVEEYKNGNIVLGATRTSVTIIEDELCVITENELVKNDLIEITIRVGIDINHIIKQVTKIQGNDWIEDKAVLTVLNEMIIDNRTTEYIIKNLMDVITIKQITKGKK